MCGFAVSANAEDWLPISAEELKMTSEPLAPAAAAIILYQQTDRDDNSPAEIHYTRIKILTEEGLKFADVELPYNKNTEFIRVIGARVVNPDGKVTEFNGTVYEKPIIQGAGMKLLAKSFTLANVHVGSIIEYRYKHGLPDGFVFDSKWILSQELFIKHASYSLNAYRGLRLTFTCPLGLPEESVGPTVVGGKVRLETRNVPAFVSEEYMPPKDAIRSRVEFIYLSEYDLAPEKDSEVYWHKYAQKAYSFVDSFTDKPRAMKAAVAQIVAPDDSPDLKLKKIYARVQQMRNLGYETDKSKDEKDRDKIKRNKDADDVWSRGYGESNQLTLLFLALVRAAGIDADAVLVSTRDTHFFNVRTMNPSQLNSYVVLVRINGKELYLDPGIAFAPFGMLPWSETAVVGMKLDKNGGNWISTPLTEPKQSRVERLARVKLTPDGTLDGTVTVTYTGQEALWRRQEEMHEDDTEKKQFLENQIKADVPVGIEVELTNRPEWNSASMSLVAEYKIRAPGWAATAGQRALLPVGLFGAQAKNAFVHAARVHPVYFNFPYQTADDIVIELPDEYRVSTLPKPRVLDKSALMYSQSTDDKDGGLHLRRDLSVHLTLVKSDHLGALQEFFQGVRSGDEEQIILTAARKTATAH
jgi:Domain of Unknown Function with PDB structure (DUF3857)/Transglutaminase-like superfamily